MADYLRDNPELLRRFGPHVAFGVPGVLMGIATLTFWSGRQRFAHIPPGGKRFLSEAFSREGLGVMGRLALIYAFVAMFWALFDQTASSWVLQAKRLDLEFLGFTWLPEQPQEPPTDGSRARCRPGKPPGPKAWEDCPE